MRRVLLALVLTGCGGFLPWFGEDEEPAPAPPVAIEGGADVASADGGSGGGSDGGSGAGEDAADSDAATWTCIGGAPGMTYPTEDECKVGRLTALCDVTNTPPNGEQCTIGNGPEDYCDLCQKVFGTSTYTFSRTTCSCR